MAAQLFPSPSTVSHLVCTLTLATSFFVSPMIQAIEHPTGGTTLQDGSTLEAWVGKEVGTAEPLEGGGKRLVVSQPVPAKSYSALLTTPCGASLQKEEPLLVVVKARSAGATPEMGAMVVKLQMKAAPYQALADTTEIPVPPTWTDLPVTLVPRGDIPPGDIVVQLLCGHKKQTLEVQSVRVVKYPTGTVTAGFPRIKRTYIGREADAPWRKAALERIEKHRKAELSLALTNSEGAALSNTEVHLKLRRHAFGFGSAVTAKHLCGTSADDARYREIVDRLFSIVVFENDLKDGNWEPFFDDGRKEKRNADLEQSFAWLGERHIRVRGHYLMQVATPFNFDGVKDNQAIHDRVLASVRERLTFVKDRVCEWDVINHPIAWSGADMLNKRPGLEKLDEEIFQLARTQTQLPFFVNEDQVFRPGPQHDDTFTYIQRLQAEGLAVQGLGNQAHFDESYLPSPTHLLEVTDHFQKLVKQQSITEYDIVTTNDDELAADYTRDVLIATFSHPAYTSFLLWGFWEGSHWKPEAASWNLDWTLKKRGEVLEEWIGKRWQTKVTLKTDAEGRLHWRGFPGWYEVTVKGSKTKDVEASAEGTSVKVRMEASPR
ncbi:endo-1,4-beta-xylanase [Roseimicrobium sp. ORNL1]|uniref:endo-1,4-beta-xylanase n=1 Tax=Roseimicrobium sp. ORNL1 TaxID=2711231 RepID=UPI0013E102DD|nr:endo-1,4-beta-xylanase [Roseimicrobium sp. ORNL1]QIF02985.1 hypothetical protein G5S37_16135 [Roseimicrobium sp. ORNL1]